MIRLRNSNISGKNANVYNYKTNFFTSNLKSALCQAKLLPKVTEISIENKKNCCKQKKPGIFLVNSYHILLAPYLLYYRYYILCFREELCHLEIIMEGEWHTLHRIEEVSNLISLLREYEAIKYKKRYA